jgi:hypothetical protein
VAAREAVIPDVSVSASDATAPATATSVYRSQAVVPGASVDRGGIVVDVVVVVATVVVVVVATSAAVVAGGVAASSSLRDARNKAIAIAPIEIATMRSHERRSIGERLGLLITCYLLLGTWYGGTPHLCGVEIRSRDRGDPNQLLEFQARSGEVGVDGGCEIFMHGLGS